MQLLGVKLRAKSYPKGWVVEAFVYCGFWKGWKWKHAISYYGLEKNPYYFSSKEIAIKQAELFFKWGLLKESDL